MKFVTVLLSCALLISLGNCQSQSLNIADINVSWTKKGEFTDFILKSSLGAGIGTSNSYIGIGFGNGMNNVNTIICKSMPFNTVQHYYNGFFNSKPFANPNVGLFNVKVSVADNVLTCSFTRKNSYESSNYFSLSSGQQTNLIGAYGVTEGSGKIRKHVKAAVSNVQALFLETAQETASTTRKPEFVFPNFTGNFFDNLQCEVPKSNKFCEKMLGKALEKMDGMPLIKNFLSSEYIGDLNKMLDSKFGEIMCCYLSKYQKKITEDVMKFYMESDDFKYMSLKAMEALESKENLDMFLMVQDLLDSMWPADWLSYNDLKLKEKKQYFKELAVIQEFISSMDSDIIDLILSSVKPELLTKIMHQPNIIHFVSIGLKYYKKMENMIY